MSSREQGRNCQTTAFRLNMNELTPYPITPIGNFVGVVLALLPLISRIRKLSLAVWGYSIWIALFNFTMFVDTIIWHDNVNIVVPVWCDIVTKLQIGVGVGTRACALVICIHLHKITRLRTTDGTAGGQKTDGGEMQRKRINTLKTQKASSEKAHMSASSNWKMEGTYISLEQLRTGVSSGSKFRYIFA